ncbi:PAS domain-containing protein [Alcaligenaceae bacterium CGII-47]|nr:PAS domain-containing protein [Alcaligenaceae bacterium CGII-47]
MASITRDRARRATLSEPRIVGIGASAGGVEALSSFFDAMPADSACAFVIILHLDPTRESQMARVLSSHTEMPVLQVKDEMRIMPNHVYVIAPDYDLEVGGGVLHLMKPSETRGHRKPVDVLFRSLARDQGDQSIAIVLSGNGTNGTDGLKDIRAEGGLILAQSPDTAKFDGMPSSAIAADLVDYILAPAKMPEALLTFLNHRRVALPGEPLATTDAHTAYREILEILQTRDGHDFKSYKLSTLSRRIQRRPNLKDMKTLDEYADLLRNDPVEVAALVKDLLINVTSFFRDPEAWKTLQEKAIEPIIANRENRSPIRVWTPSCSTGEEAYSIAMLVTERAEAAGKQFDLKVFATDARESNLQKARNGIYPEAALSGFPPERLRRFFDKTDGSYQVKKDLRNLLVFAPQNLLSDPPFSRMDLISCRNLLIYLEADAQKKIITLAHFALRDKGYLFLGNAETIGRHDNIFETISKKWRIYRKIGPMRHDILNFPSLRGTSKPRPPNERVTFLESNTSVGDVARRALLEHYAPASVLIDGNAGVLYYHGQTGDYLEQPTGEPTKDLIAMARHGLAAKLRGAVQEAMDGNKRVTTSARVRYEGTSRPVTIIVTPLTVALGDGDRLLVSFEQTPSALTQSTTDRRDSQQGANDVHDLQEELTAVRFRLQNTIEHLETTNEELKASNEETTSMNEELQSTNEELETSKEELQSFNEELNTINSQLQHKIVELEDVTNDLNNLLTGSEVATLFLDNKFCIKWFSPTTRELFDLVSSDIGRPVSHFARKFSDDNLLPDAEQVLTKLSTIEAEVSADSGRWYLRRMLPYRTQDNHIAGVVITFNDITDQKHATDAVHDARIYSEAVIETIRQPLLVLTADLRVKSANRAFYGQFRARQRDTEGQPIDALGNGQWAIPRLQALLKEVLSKNQFVEDFEVEHDFRDIGRRCMMLNARKLVRKGHSEELIVLAIEDVSELRERENAMQ